MLWFGNSKEPAKGHPPAVNIDEGIVVTTVDPLFGAPFKVVGRYTPSMREMIFGDVYKLGS